LYLSYLIVYFKSFTKELSIQLKEARNERTDFIDHPLLVQDPWMVLSEIRPQIDDDEEDNIENDSK
jgi:hypothetical protein